MRNETQTNKIQCFQSNLDQWIDGGVDIVKIGVRMMADDYSNYNSNQNNVNVTCFDILCNYQNVSFSFG